MKLNPDCIRNILLTVEENTTFDKAFVYDYNTYKQYFLLESYTHDEIIYHIHQAELNFLFSKVSYCDNGKLAIIFDLSPTAHEFISNIRSKNNWSKTKEIANKVGSTSINTFIEISSNVISSLISKQFGI